MKKVNKKILGLITVVVLILLAPLCFIDFSTPSPTSAEDYRDTNIECLEFSKDIVINENKVCLITEKLVFNYKENYINVGFVRSVSKANEITRKVDGKEYRTKTLSKFKLLSLAMDGHNEYKFVEEGSGFYYINVGRDGDYKVGRHEYELIYSLDFGEDMISEFDDFTFDIKDEDFGFDIALFNCSVTFPEGKDILNGKDLAEVLTLRTHLNRPNLDLRSFHTNYDSETNTLSFSRDNVSKTTCVTMQLILPQKYFDTSFTPNSSYWALLVVCITTVFLILILSFGSRIHKNEVETVEFYPPEGLNPIDVGRIYRGNVLPKDFASLVIEWAGKGLIKLEFKSKYHIILTKLQDFPSFNASIPFSSKQKEKAYFDALFASSNVFDTKVAKRKVNAKLRDATDKLYKENDVVKKKRNIFRLLISLIAILPLVFYIVWQGTIGGFEFVLLFLLLFPLIAINVFVYTPIPLWFKIIWCAGFGGVPLWLLVTTYSYSYDIYSLGLVAALILVIGTMFGRIVKFYPKEERVIRGQIKGFKNFLVKAELSKLEMQLEEDPEYFYKILPYCYVFGITKKMEKRFKNLNVEKPEYLDSSVSYSYIGFALGHSMSRASGRSSSGGRSTGGGGHGGSSGGGGGGGGCHGR